MNSRKENFERQLNLRLTNRQAEALKRVANISGTTQTKLVRSLIEPVLQLAMATQCFKLQADKSKEKAG